MIEGDIQSRESGHVQNNATVHVLLKRDAPVLPSLPHFSLVTNCSKKGLSAPIFSDKKDLYEFP